MAKAKTLWNKADKVCGDWFRGCRCRAIGKFGIECSGRIEWAHIVSRSVGVIRWHPLNAYPLCSAHHRYFTQRPLIFAEFAEGRKERLQEIEREIRSNGGKPDPSFWYAWYKSRHDNADTWNGEI